MPKKLVICFDGTNNQFGTENTNVIRLIQVLDRDPTRQRLYYDPGVGTLPEPNAFTRLQKWFSKVYGLAFGGGLLRKVGEAYSFLMETWEPKDQVFLFGFSRGAYSARVLAGLLYNLGLLPRGNSNLIPYAMRLNGSVSETDSDGETAGQWKLCRDFRRTFAVDVGDGDDQRRFPVHFLGVWDTVSSVGWVWDPKKYPYTSRNPGIAVARHAVSIDERRWFFRQNLLQQADGQDLQQRWFPGVHSDVGGGYPESDGGLWRAPFQWILEEAHDKGLLVDESRIKEVLGRPPVPAAPWDDPQHESLKGAWWLAEFFPKVVWHPDTRTKSPDIGRGRHRFLRDGDVLHKATLLRIRETTYAPPNLSESFRQRVRGLDLVPDSLPYHP